MSDTIVNDLITYNLLSPVQARKKINNRSSLYYISSLRFSNNRWLFYTKDGRKKLIDKYLDKFADHFKNSLIVKEAIKRYGEERVSLEILQNKGEVLEEDCWSNYTEFIHKLVKGFEVILKIYYPEITITDANGVSYTINKVFITIKLKYPLTLSSSSITIFKSSFNLEEIFFGFIHSHARSKNNASFCMGTHPLALIIYDLELKNHDDFEYFFVLLDDFLSAENTADCYRNLTNLRKPGEKLNIQTLVDKTNIEADLSYIYFYLAEVSGLTSELINNFRSSPENILKHYRSEFLSLLIKEVRLNSSSFSGEKLIFKEEFIKDFRAYLIRKQCFNLLVIYNNNNYYSTIQEFVAKPPQGNYLSIFNQDFYFKGELVNIIINEHSEEDLQNLIDNQRVIINPYYLNLIKHFIYELYCL